MQMLRQAQILRGLHSELAEQFDFIYWCPFLLFTLAMMCHLHHKKNPVPIRRVFVFYPLRVCAKTIGTFTPNTA
jgi:hypothetical protein